MAENVKKLSTAQKLRELSKQSGRGVNMWDGARFVLVDMSLNRSGAKQVLPWLMNPTDECKATLFISDYPKTSFTAPYKEAAVFIHVKTPLGKGIHCPWMVVDDDTALVYGRELLGYPKKFAEIIFEEENGHISASVARRGTMVLKVELDKGEAQNPAPPVFNYKTFNVGGMGQFFAFQPIWMFRPKEVVKESCSANVTVELNDSEFDPIANLVEGEPISGRFAVTDIPGGSYMVPVGMAGPGWFANNFNLRYR